MVRLFVCLMIVAIAVAAVLIQTSTYTSTPFPERLELETYYDFFIKQQQLETTNVNARLSWGLTVQGFLFAALALLARAGDTEVGSTLRIALPLVGITTGFATFCGTLAGLGTIGDLESQWKEWVKLEQFPLPFAEGGVKGYLGSLSGWFVPLAMFGVWCFIAFRFSGRRTPTQDAAT